MLAKADDVRNSVSELSIQGIRGISCSIGIASFEGKYDFADVYAAADRALYHSKKLGKNCCSLENM